MDDYRRLTGTVRDGYIKRLGSIARYADILMCLAGADPGLETPAALVRGGKAGYGTSSGPLSVHGDSPTYVITSYSIHYTKLYDGVAQRLRLELGGLRHGG